MRPVHIIVPIAPSLTPDILARLIGQRLSEKLGQPFIIENRPGGDQTIGTEIVARAAPDGYTLLLMTAACAVNASLYEHLNYNFIRDIAPATGLVRVPLVMEVNPSVPAKTLPSSSTTPKPIQAKSIWLPAATGDPAACGRRTVQDDDWHRHGSHTLSREHASRSDGRTSSGLLWSATFFDRIYPVGKTSCACCDQRGALRRACPVSPLLPNSFPVSRLTLGMASARPRARPFRSPISSIWR